MLKGTRRVISFFYLCPRESRWLEVLKEWTRKSSLRHDTPDGPTEPNFDRSGSGVRMLESVRVHIGRPSSPGLHSEGGMHRSRHGLQGCLQRLVHLRRVVAAGILLQFRQGSVQGVQLRRRRLRGRESDARSLYTRVEPQHETFDSNSNYVRYIVNFVMSCCDGACGDSTRIFSHREFVASRISLCRVRCIEV